MKRLGCGASRVRQSMLANLVSGNEAFASDGCSQVWSNDPTGP